jgi:hypothetical protein
LIHFENPKGKFDERDFYLSSVKFEKNVWFVYDKIRLKSFK